MSPRSSPASSSAALNAGAASASWLSRQMATEPAGADADDGRPVAQCLRHHASSAAKNSPEAGLLQLAGGGERQGAGADEAEFPGHLVGGEALATVRRQGFGRARGALARHDHGGDPLVPLRVRQADHVGELDLRHLGEHRLDLRRRDVDAAGLDHLLEPPAEVQEALGVQQPEVAGTEPALVEGPRVLRRILVVAACDVAPDQDLADGTCRERRQAFGVGDRDIDAGERPADRREPFLQRVVHVGNGAVAVSLRQPVDVADLAHPEVDQPLDLLGRAQRGPGP